MVLLVALAMIHGFFFAISIIVASIVCFCIGKKRVRENKSFPKLLRIFSTVGLIYGIAEIVTPFLILGFISFANHVLVEPEEHADVLIEERGYREDECFKVGTKKYEVLELSLYSEDALGDEPVFSYREHYFMTGYEYTNYYAVENGRYFDIVSDGSRLFCPVDQKERVLEYYSDAENLMIHFKKWDGAQYRSSYYKAVQPFLSLDTDSLPEKKITVDNMDDVESASVTLVCNQDLIMVDKFYFVRIDGELYYKDGSKYDYDTKTYEYTLRELPELVKWIMNAMGEQK